MRKPSTTGPDDGRRCLSDRCRSLLAAVTAMVSAASTTVVLSAPALADVTESLRSAVVQERAASSCGPLTANPLVEQAAYTMNKSTNDYLDHVATNAPITDPLPGLKILGYPGNKAIALQSGTHTQETAIKALILQGFDKIPDCSFTDFGLDVQRNGTSGYELMVVVLAGA